MTGKEQAGLHTDLPRAGASSPAWPAPPAPFSLEERLKRIQELGKRISGYVEFMCQADRLNGASAEVREKAIALFCEEMAALERRLGRIQEDLRLA
jgi:hypothetical protein